MTDLSGFETFTKRMVPLGKDPYVTIQKRGLISFNKSAYVAMGSPVAVELLYNRETRVVAIRPATEDVAHAYRFRSIRGQTEATTYMVAATAFTNYYGIPTEVSVRRKVQIVDGGLLLIDLNDEGTVVTSNRKPRTVQPTEN